jgi:biotin transporter BioY
MGSLIGFIFLWLIVAVPIGWAFAYVESRVNKAPMRLKSAILLSVFLGFIGWIILAMRSGLTYAGKQRENQQVTADAARLLIKEREEREQQL